MSKPSMPTVEQVLELRQYHETRIPAAYVDLNGHMNIRHYPALHDDAHWPHLDALGLGEGYTQSRGRGFFGLEQHLRYLREVNIGDHVSVHVRMIERSAKLMHFLSFIVNRSTAEVANTMETVTAHADLSTRRVIPLDADDAAVLDRYLADHQGLDWDAPVCGAMGVRPSSAAGSTS